MARPPKRSDCSKSVTLRRPPPASALAAVRPARPPPTTTYSFIDSLPLWFSQLGRARHPVCDSAAGSDGDTIADPGLKATNVTSASKADPFNPGPAPLRLSAIRQKHKA